MRRTALMGVLTLAFTAGPETAAPAQLAARADSVACTTAKQRVTSDLAMLARLDAQLANPNESIQKVRAAQIKTRISQLEKDLAAARVARFNACGPSLADYAGRYSGMFGRIEINFIVVGNGVVSGDIVSALGRTIDPKTGVVDAQANFLGADCGYFKVFFNARAGTAAASLTCTLAGLTESHAVVAHRH
ncbi:MAG: hypothetical protein ACHQFZ_08625 [Acidimicrobiales bacterium]